MYQRIQKVASWNSPTQQTSSQLSPRAKAQHNSARPLTQAEREKQAFGQDCNEASRLQLKEKIGGLTSLEQEKLSLLQAKMNNFWVQKREKASRFGHNIANISISSPHKRDSTPIQPKQASQPYREDVKQQSLQQLSGSASKEGMGSVQKAFLATPAPQGHPMPTLQAKLTIGEPGDKYEQEADSVAAEVVNQIASRQEQYLSPEAWHVVQQKQGRMKPTTQLKKKVTLNDEGVLEREADEMRAKSLQRKEFQLKFNSNESQKTNLASSSTVQLKPKDINNTNILNVDQTGNVTNNKADRNDIPVSYPLNIAIDKGILKSKQEFAVGGHLFKREYGGADDYSNVVTWSKKSEQKFTDFEEQYLKKARTDARETGGVSREVKTEATFTNFKVNLKDISLPDKEAPDGSMIQDRTIEKEKKTEKGKTANYLLTNLIRGAMESIPNSVKASSKGVDTWEKSGKDEFMKINENIDKEQVAIQFDYIMDGVDEDIQQITRAVNKVKEM